MNAQMNAGAVLHDIAGTPGARAPEAETALAATVQNLVASGDQAAARELFSQIVGRQQRRASRIAWHYLRDAADADEAVQDAFVKAYTHIGSFQPTLSFEVWFTRILINGCLDRQKARTRRSPVSSQRQLSRTRNRLAGRSSTIPRSSASARSIRCADASPGRRLS